MQFNSLTYFIFLPLVFGLHWLCKNARQQNAILLAASMVFYGWWDMACLMLMVGTCLINYLSALHLRGKLAQAATLIINFGILGTFKYFDFFSHSFGELLHLFGTKADMPTLNVILPMGISFYIFQLSAYIVDCHAGRIRPCNDPVRFLTFICFFPQLVAGPIERGAQLLPQFERKRMFNDKEATYGMRLILWGLFKKVLVADNCATQVEFAFAHYDTISMASLWLGALYFTIQIYCDFSGYSDIAIGSAKLFGISLTRNFNRPYFATSMQDFWRRWHISLMNWLRDYVYIPLGGSRCSAIRKNMNMLSVFLVSGLWHGAGWTYICWGLYHAMVYRQKGHFMLIPIMIGWVIFCAPDMHVALSYIQGMFNPYNMQGDMALSRLPLFLSAMLMATEWIMKDNEHPFVFKDAGWQSKQAVRLSCYFATFLAIYLAGGRQTTFIYFQF